MVKECPKHGLTLFSDKGRLRCRKCAVESVTKRRRLLKQKAIDYKGGKCEKCGYDKCNAALDFHHLDPDTKDFALGVTGQTRSWERIKAEIDKCILVCSNCHREIHFELENK